MHIDTILQARKNRWREFYDFSKPPRSMFWIHYEPGLAPRPWPLPHLIEERVEWSWQKYQVQQSLVEWLDDDSLPFLDVFTGTELFAEAFGCQVHYMEFDMPFAKPLIHSAEEADKLPVPPLDAPALDRVWRIARELKRRGGDNALLRLPDIQSPMDIAALIWEKSSFYAAMMDEPEAVAGLARKVRVLLTCFLDAWFAEFGSDFIAHYPDYYVPKGITLSEDEVGAVSPEIFRELFLPELEELSHRYGGIGVHCCANSYHQWAGFAKIPGLFLLNLNQPPDLLRKAYPLFEPVCAQMHAWFGDGPMATWPQQHPVSRRIVFDLWAENRDQALELAESIKPYRSN